LVEPLLGRGGCIVPPRGFLLELTQLAHAHGALLIDDEIWTGLGRTGNWLACQADPEAAVVPDLVLLGKGLGGGVPLSACVGRASVMQSWRREAEVVHTATFAGAPLACAAAHALLDELETQALPERARRVGEQFRRALEARLASRLECSVRGRGLMVAVELGGRPGRAVWGMRELLKRGYVVSTGGGQREVLVFTPPLVISELALEAFVSVVGATLDGGSP
jgi:4-aminobutyrate aminotransferase/(S)-3-amino-2-methylpropionate transaminase